MTTNQLPKYILPVELAEKMVCSDCHGYLSCGPIKLQKERYICGRCTAIGNNVVVLPHIFESFLANSIFPCKYNKEGCKTTVQFNDSEKHEEKCSRRKILCPELNCTEAVLLLNLYDHFKQRHLKCLIDDCQFKLDLNENYKQIFLMYESDCIIVIKYFYNQTTKTLQLSVAPVIENSKTVDKYQLKISNENYLDNNISLSKKNCHLYNDKHLKTEHFDDINISDCVSPLNNPKAVIINIFLIYSNNIPKSIEDAQLDDVEKNATKILQKHSIKKSRVDSYSYENYPPITLNDSVVPCQWKGCKQSGKIKEILKHQYECEFQLYQCPFKVSDCHLCLYDFDSFLEHLETHEKRCSNPNKVIIPLYRKLFSTQKVYRYFTFVNRSIVQIQCKVYSDGRWNLVCSSSINIRVNVYFGHEHCRLTLRAHEKTNTKCAKYNKDDMSLFDCFVEYPRLNAVLSIDTC